MPVKFLQTLLCCLICHQISCRSMENGWDTVKYHCGDSVSQSYRYVTVAGENALVTDAIGIEQGEVQAFKILNDTCIEVPKEFAGRLLYRGPNISQDFELQASSGLAFLELRSGAELAKISEELKCAGSDIYSAGEFNLEFLRQDAANFGHYLHELSIYDQSEKLLFREFVHAGSLPLPLDKLNIKDGSYKLAIRSADAFDLAKGLGPKINSCQLIVDRLPPRVASSLRAGGLLREDLFQLNADQNIRFDTWDTNPKAIYFCLASKENDCTEENDFKIVQDVVPAPKDGIWNLFYFATDQAGNRSDMQRESFAVYHQQQVNLIRKNFLNSALYGLAKRPKEGLLSYQLALQDYDALTLAEERKALYWDLVGSFWRLEENVSLRYELDLPGIKRIWADPFSERFAVAAEQAYLIEKQNITPIDEGIQEWVFQKNGDYFFLKASGDFVAMRDGLRQEITLPVRRGNLSLAPGGFALVYGNEGLFLIDVKEEQLPFKQIRELDRRIPGFGPGFFVSEDENFLVFYHRNLVEVIPLKDNPDFKASHAVKLDAPCGVTNVYLDELSNVVIIGRFSVTLSQGLVDQKCGIFRWNPVDDQIAVFPYTGEIGSDYTPENSFFRVRDDVLSLVVHDRLGPAYYYGLHRLSESWGLNSGIGWGLTQVGSSFNQLNQITASFSQDFTINKTDRELVVTPTPYPYLDQSPLFRLEEQIEAADLIAGETDIAIATGTGLAVHSLTNSMQGKLVLIDTEDVDKTSFYNDSQALFAHHQQSGVSYDWVKQRFLFHDQDLRPVRNDPIKPVPTALAYFEKTAIWADRAGDLYLWQEGSPSPQLIASGFQFVKQIEIIGSLNQLLVLETNDRYEEKLSLLRLADNGQYSQVFESSKSTLPIVFRRAPSEDSILFVLEVDWGVFEVHSYDLQWNQIARFQHDNAKVFYSQDGQAILYPEGNHILVRALAGESQIKLALHPETNAADIKRLAGNSELIFYSTGQGVFRQNYEGKAEKIPELTELLQWEKAYLLAQKAASTLVLIDPTSLQELASTQLGITILPDKTTQIGDEIFVFGKDSAKRRYGVRRLSLNPDSIRKSLETWPQ